MSQKSDQFYSTIGVHPCHATHPKDQGIKINTYFDQIKDTLKSDRNSKIVAIGECGLDFDRQEYADIDS